MLFPRFSEGGVLGSSFSDLLHARVVVVVKRRMRSTASSFVFTKQTLRNRLIGEAKQVKRKEIERKKREKNSKMRGDGREGENR